MFSDNGERRKDIRYDLPKKIEYVLNPETSGKIYSGVTVNISNSGLCLYIFHPLTKGQKIIIQSTLPVPYQTAMVLWIKKVDDDLYKAGVMFTDNSKNLS